MARLDAFARPQMDGLTYALNKQLEYATLANASRQKAGNNLVKLFTDLESNMKTHNTEDLTSLLKSTDAKTLTNAKNMGGNVNSYLDDYTTALGSGYLFNRHDAELVKAKEALDLKETTTFNKDLERINRLDLDEIGSDEQAVRNLGYNLDTRTSTEQTNARDGIRNIIIDKLRTNVKDTLVRQAYKHGTSIEELLSDPSIVGNALNRVMQDTNVQGRGISDSNVIPGLLSEDLTKLNTSKDTYVTRMTQKDVAMLKNPNLSMAPDEFDKLAAESPSFTNIDPTVVENARQTSNANYAIQLYDAEAQKAMETAAKVFNKDNINNLSPEEVANVNNSFKELHSILRDYLLRSNRVTDPAQRQKFINATEVTFNNNYQNTMKEAKRSLANTYANIDNLLPKSLHNEGNFQTGVISAIKSNESGDRLLASTIDKFSNDPRVKSALFNNVSTFVAKRTGLDINNPTHKDFIYKFASGIMNTNAIEKLVKDQGDANGDDVIEAIDKAFNEDGAINKYIDFNSTIDKNTYIKLAKQAEIAKILSNLVQENAEDTSALTKQIKATSNM